MLIPGRLDLQGNIQTLTEFALRHLPGLRADDIRPRSRTARHAAASHTGRRRRGATGSPAGPEKPLPETPRHPSLEGQTEDSRERRRLFCRQLPWQVLQYAHEQTLQERLSASAWG